MEQNKNPESPLGMGDQPLHPHLPVPRAEQQPLATPVFQPVELRYRHDGWTPERQRAFIEQLADTLCADTAAERVGMSAQSAYALRRRKGAEGFSAAWDAALRQGLAHHGRSRIVAAAVNGRLVRRFYRGQLIDEERVYSERLLLALVEKGAKLFGDAPGDASAAIAADWDASMEKLESGALEVGYRVWKDRWGSWETNFPPPSGFSEYAGEPSDPDFSRSLTEAEENALAAQAKARLEQGETARDRFFGFTPRRRATDRRTRLER